MRDLILIEKLHTNKSAHNFSYQFASAAELVTKLETKETNKQMRKFPSWVCAWWQWWKCRFHFPNAIVNLLWYSISHQNAKNTRESQFPQSTNTTVCTDSGQTSAVIELSCFHSKSFASISNGKGSMLKTTNAVILIVPSSTAVWHINSAFEKLRHDEKWQFHCFNRMNLVRSPTHWNA